MELAINVIERAWRRLVAHRGADRLAADDAFEAHGPHQAGNRAAGRANTIQAKHSADDLTRPGHLLDECGAIARNKLMDGSVTLIFANELPNFALRYLHKRKMRELKRASSDSGKLRVQDKTGPEIWKAILAT
jgi:hypothetical protein